MSIDLPITRLSRKAQRRILVGWLAALTVGLAGLHVLITREVERDRHQWEIRLNLVAAAHADAASGWVEAKRSVLKNLVGNVSLKLYLSELTYGAHENSDITTDPAELTYLRNLLIASADLGGFSSPPQDSATIGANIAPEPGAGMMVTDAQFTPVASTRALPSLEGLPPSLTQSGSPDKLLMSPAFERLPGKPAIAFRLPVYGVQQDSASTPLGYLFAVTLLDASFYDLLSGIANDEKTAESLLLEPQGSLMRFISPLQDGNKPLSLAVDSDSTLACVTAARSPGTLVDAVDYRGNRSLAIARPVKGTDWLLAHKIDTSIAMYETHARAFFLYMAYVLCAAFISAGVVALWRHATALRARQVATHYKSLSQRIQKQEALLDLIAETTPIASYIVDAEGKYCYANRRAAQDAEMDRSAMPGKSLEGVLGAHRARRLLAANAQALATDTPQLLVQREEEDGALKDVHQTRHIPLDSIPLPNANTEDGAIRGVLVIDQDITDIVRGEERRATTLRQLIDTLVEMVDRRDPHAARHSACVAMAARETGRQMRLDEPMVRTAEIAGQLMNIGKVSVPESLLTAKDALKDKDKDRIRASILASVDVLEGIEFDGPVVETLRQSLAKNPELVSAQIIAVANDFVAMISPRAWRGGMKMEEAMTEIMKHAGTRYERAVVAALVNYLDNAGGRKAVQECLHIKA